MYLWMEWANHLNWEKRKTGACICETREEGPHKHPDGKVDVQVGEGNEDGDQGAGGCARMATLISWLFHSRHNLEGFIAVLFIIFVFWVGQLTCHNLNHIEVQWLIYERNPVSVFVSQILWPRTQWLVRFTCNRSHLFMSVCGKAIAAIQYIDDNKNADETSERIMTKAATAPKREKGRFPLYFFSSPA